MSYSSAITLHKRGVLRDAGFGLVETMIAAAIISIVALGIATIINDLMSYQNRANATAVVNQSRSLIIQTIQNGSSWATTIGHAENGVTGVDMNCLVTGSACTKDTPKNFNLKFADGTEAFNSISTTRGFDASGRICSAYPSAACPFRWDLQWTARCPGSGGASCSNPDVEVVGTLTVASGSTFYGGSFNPARYAIDIKRGAEATRNDAVIVTYVENDSTGEGGGCKSNSVWTQRAFNTVVSDPANNVINKTGTTLNSGNSIQLRAGVYNCTVIAPAFKNGGNRIRLRNTAGSSVSVVSPVAIASLSGGSAALQISTTLILNSNTTLLLEQQCTNEPTDSPNGSQNNGFSLGVPVPINGTYNGVTYSTFTCAKTS